jgi:hypothetical protein
VQPVSPLKKRRYLSIQTTCADVRINVPLAGLALAR